MKPVDSRIRAVVISILAASVLSAAPSAVDRVRIVSVSPESVTRGVPIELAVVVEADLESAPSGIIRLGVNDFDVALFDMVDLKEVSHGLQRVEFKRMVVPVDWGREGHFTMVVKIGGPVKNPWFPLSSAEQKIAVTR
jgi:hypothetical protein